VSLFLKLLVLDDQFLEFLVLLLSHRLESIGFNGFLVQLSLYLGYFVLPSFHFSLKLSLLSLQGL
jgi:hypothetical protein